MINWYNYFDKIYCLFYTPYIKRKQLMQFQLDRVGILNSNIFEWYYTFGNKIDKDFNQYIHDKKCKNDWIINVSITLGHYKIIRDAYYKGYNKILILEDDIRFLKDLNKIKQILDNRPQNINVIMYDKFIFNYNMLKQFKPINDYFSTFTSCCSTGCYQLDRKGMQRVIQIFEEKPITADAIFFKALHYLKNLNYRCSNINLAVQATFKQSNNTIFYKNDFLKSQSNYKYLEICFDDYMMRKDGSPYYYGDYIEE